MAIFRHGPLASALSGTIHSLNFAIGPSGAYIRRRAIRTDRQSAKQLEVRAAYSSAFAAWRALSENKRQGWRATAARVPHTNALGVKSPLSGATLYLQQFMWGRHAGYASPTIPPVAIAQSPPTAIVLALWVAGSSNITVSASNLIYPAQWQLWLTRPFSTYTPRSHNRWTFCHQDDTFGSVVYLDAPLAAAFSPLIAGETFLSRIRIGSPNRLLSASLTGTHTVT